MKKGSGYYYRKVEKDILWDYIKSLLKTISKGNDLYVQAEIKRIKYKIWEAQHENQD